MKNLFLAALLATGVGYAAQAQNVAINTDGTAADNSAILDVKSTTQGMLVPRVTNTQRTGITLPATGLIVYQTDGTSGFYYNVGTPAVPNWAILLNGGAAAGGDLAGSTYPNPTIANDAVTSAKIADNAVTIAKLPSGATGTTFLRGDGTWVTPAGGAPVLQLAVQQNGGNFNATTTTPTVFDWATPTTNVSTQFNTTTDTFTAATAGTYYINATVTMGSASTGMITIKRGLSSIAFASYGQISSIAATGYPVRAAHTSVMIVLAANETIQIEGVSASASAAIDNKGFLYIYKY